MIKISKRETTLIVVLILAIIGYFLYTFIYVPKAAQMSELKAELELSKVEVSDMELKIASITKLEKNIAAEKETAQNGAPLFFDNIVQENLIALLNELGAKASSFRVDSYGFAVLAVGNIPEIEAGSQDLQYFLKQLVDGYKIKYEGVEPQISDLNENIGADTSNQLAKASVNITFTGTYSGLLNYLKALESYDKKIIVSSINVAESRNNSLNGSMTLEFYTLPKLYPDSSDLPFMEWKYNKPKGKTNLFSGLSGSGEISAAPQAAQPQTAQANMPSVSYRNPDFFAIARSATSDMPTLTLGTGGETQIQNTIDGQENVTVEFTAEGGRYYYSYETSGGAYPPEGRAEFAPIRTGEIHFIIYSNNRVSERDTNTINLKIVNGTGLALVWGVDGDDESNPRVKVDVT